MTALPPDPALSAREFEFGSSEFRRIAAVVHDQAGITLPETKRPLVYSRLARRLRALDLRSFSEYCDLIESHAGTDEHEELILAITTNVTAFFREKHHFDFLRENVLPGLVGRARSGERVRFWSAACSSGEEPYSIAMTLLEVCPDAHLLDIRILATDIDRNVLSKGQRGRYPSASCASIPSELASKYLEADRTCDQFQIKDTVKSLITFKRLNLLADWPFSGPFDVIFCRNVVIYFDRPTQEMIWSKFNKVLKTGSHMMIGHSERISGPMSSVMNAIAVTTYKKT